MSKSTFDMDKELERAVQYHKSGELEKAQEIYKEVLGIIPDHSDALHLSGVVAHQVGNDEKAKDD